MAKVALFDNALKGIAVNTLALKVDIGAKPEVELALRDDIAHEPLDISGRCNTRGDNIAAVGCLDDVLGDLDQNLHDLSFTLGHGLEPACCDALGRTNKAEPVVGEGLKALIKRCRETVAVSAVFAADIDLDISGLILFDYSCEALYEALVADLDRCVILLHLGERNAPCEALDLAGLMVSYDHDGAEAACRAHIIGEHGLHNGVFIILIGRNEPHIHSALVHEGRQEIVKAVAQKDLGKFGLLTQRQKACIIKLLSDSLDYIHKFSLLTNIYFIRLS